MRNDRVQYTWDVRVLRGSSVVLYSTGTKSMGYQLLQYYYYQACMLPQDRKLDLWTEPPLIICTLAILSLAFMSIPQSRALADSGMNSVSTPSSSTSIKKFKILGTEIAIKFERIWELRAAWESKNQHKELSSEERRCLGSFLKSKALALRNFSMRICCTQQTRSNPNWPLSRDWTLAASLPAGGVFDPGKTDPW